MFCYHPDLAYVGNQPSESEIREANALWYAKKMNIESEIAATKELMDLYQLKEETARNILLKSRL